VRVFKASFLVGGLTSGSTSKDLWEEWLLFLGFTGVAALGEGLTLDGLVERSSG